MDHSSRAVTIPAAMVEADDTPHLLAATYYSLKDDLRATLMLNNKGPHPLEVQATLFSAGGERLEVPAITVEGNAFRELDLREYAGANPSFAEGSIQVFYRGHDLMLGAQVYLVDAGRSLIFEEKLLELEGSFASSRLEGVWWMPSPRCDARLVLSNTTAAQLSVTANVEGARPGMQEPATLALAPHETRVVDVLRDLAGTPGGRLMEAGGISLHHSGAAGALMARMLVQDPAEGYSTWVRFSDPQKGKSNRLHGAGLRLGSVGGEKLTPVVVARNVGDSETVITGRIPYTGHDGQTGMVALPDLRLAPGEAGTFNLIPALAQSRIEQGVAAAGLEFEHTGAPGSVLLSAQSVSRSRNHVFHVPLWDIVGQRSSTGGYPWTVAGQTSTIVYLKNVTEREQQYTWQLSYEGGVYSLGLKTIAPHQTVAIDIRALRDGRVPDAKGRTIPPTATRGQVLWSIRGPENLVMIGRAEQVDIAHGMASSYACQNCCPNTPYDTSATNCFDPLFPTETSQLRSFERDITCYGTLLDAYEVFPFDWFSYNVGIASVDGGGLAKGEGAGNTTIQSSWWVTTWQFQPVYNSCNSSWQQVAANALCQITSSVRISSVSFSPATIARTSGSTTLRVQISVSTGVPPNTQVLVEAFQDTNPAGVSLLISPTNGQNGVMVTPGTVAPVEFLISTSGANTKSGMVKYAARILSATPPPGSNVTVGIGTAQNNGVSNELTVQ